MNDDLTNKQSKESKTSKETGKLPNEFGGVYVSSNIKIWDPNTKEILVQKRGDN